MSLTEKYQAVGRFDASTSAQHQAELVRLLDGAATSLEIDLSKIEFLSSAGLRVLLFVANEAHKKGGTLQLTGTRAVIREVIVAVGFDDIVLLKD